MKSRIAAAIILLLFPVGLPAASSAAEKPNVLFIAIDDLNDWIGCLNGHPQALTPNIDALAEAGILFTNAHCVSPACNPSRAALLSGRRPASTGVWSNDSPRLLQAKPQIDHLPGVFRDAGYATLGTGKINHGTGDNAKLFEKFYNTEQRWSPLTREAVRYTADELPTKKTDAPKHVATLSDGRTVTLPLNSVPSDRNPDTKEGESFDWGPMAVADSEMGDVKITDWAIEQLSKQHDKPFFMGVGYYRPHIPLWAPAKYFERFENVDIQLPPTLDGDLDDLSPTGRRWAIEAVTAGSHATVVRSNQWRQAVKSYLACTTFVDEQVGRLVSSLKRSRQSENTWIVLWTDHGWHLGEKEHWGKWTPWERSTRVPLIIVPPSAIAAQFAEAGSRCDQPVSLLDLFPTLTDACGINSPKDLHGQSLLPLLKNPGLETNRAVVTLFDEGNVTLRTNRWRYIRYDNGDEELYDVIADPNEWHNLAVVPKHRSELIKLREAASEHVVLAKTNDTAEPEWLQRKVVGWRVHVNPRLTKDDASRKKLGRAMELLTVQLKEIKQKLPKDAVAELQKVDLWFSPKYPNTGARAEYHPSPQWLRENGRSEIMARGVEFSNVEIFEAESRRMPNFALHELAHAFHDRVLGFDHAEIRKVFDRAVASGKYESVLRQDANGNRRPDRAYALSNHKEYFAELSEAYFSKNDFFPFDRTELLETDPEGARVVKEAWGVTP
ncbi:sulfatase-like hydrolase/transferase [Stieleria varia]|uniref:Choline-sulfatase n=1 Tax=Stieleria varia TaxID=2528005 RepID=A0A5C5ZPN0_9BACT|nr:sulfatase-like hydrolase/transferase [Stieleria varia]TWT89429.1 Choline-sulfatase [Stieleria varia]